MAFLERSNISIKFIDTFFGRRASRYLDAVASVAMEAALVLVAWRIFIYAFQVRRAGDVTFMLAAPIAPFWLAVASLIALTSLVQALVIVLEIRRCLGREVA